MGRKLLVHECIDELRSNKMQRLTKMPHLFFSMNIHCEYHRLYSLPKDESIKAMWYKLNFNVNKCEMIVSRQMNDGGEL